MSSTGAKRLVRKDHQVLNQSSYNWHQTLRCAATSCQFQSSQRLGLIIISNEPIKKPQQTRVANTHPTFKQTRFTPRAASFNRQLLFDFKLSLFLRNFNYASTSLDFTRKYSLLRCLFVTFFDLLGNFVQKLRRRRTQPVEQKKIEIAKTSVRFLLRPASRLCWKWPKCREQHRGWCHLDGSINC